MHTIDPSTTDTAGSLSGSARVDVSATFNLQAETRITTPNRAALLNFQLLRFLRDAEDGILDLSEEEAALEIEALKNPRVAGTAAQEQPPVHPRVERNKRLRQATDAILQELKATIASRHHSLARTHLEDAIMRLGMDLKQCREEGLAGSDPNPYPSSYDPSSPVVEPTSGGVRL